jgi:N utilization substance protein A
MHQRDRAEQIEVSPVMTLDATEQIARLFARFVPEVESGVVEVKAAVRMPGKEMKVAVLSHERRVDAVKSCTAHVKKICDELGDKRIQITLWSDSPEQLIRQAVPLGVLGMVTLDDAKHKAVVELAPEDFAVATRFGNVELASRLSGWDIELRQLPPP